MAGKAKRIAEGVLDLTNAVHSRNFLRNEYEGKTGQIASYHLEQRILKGERVIFRVAEMRIRAGVSLMLVFDKKADGTLHNNVTQVANVEPPLVFQTGMVNPPHAKILLPPGWTAVDSGVAANGDDFAADEFAIWRLKAPNTSGPNIVAGDIAKFYGGYQGIVNVYEKHAAWQFNDAAGSAPNSTMGESYVDGPTASWLVANPLNGVDLTAHFFAR